ncbi:hypothetical protein [Actinomycetospora termitidis]|uniref:Lipoprotein n=1 Tax=Actinomycetospora termitidis TaxID=3053470 RepID=A0ABT7M8S2_9PSEU|nr:hypothetical protein [Actinomycetospora sp. Odt1-22]MDL5157071.1 hypothetical protein [Actinomycetospora sp. Odt1-22]
MRLVLLLAALALLVTGCATGGPPPPPSSTTTPAVPSDLTGNRVLTPARGMFSVEVPARFADVPASAPEAAAVPPLARAIGQGAGVLAVDRRQGYSPTAGGYCTLVQSRDLPQLAAEAREALQGSGAPVEAPEFTVLPATGPAGPRVSGTYRSTGNGRTLTVQQVAGLAGPGRACLLTVSTDDAARDAGVLTTARDTFRMAG